MLHPEKRLLAASARRTFCTVGDKYTAHVGCLTHKDSSVLFGIPWAQLMAVTHHKCPQQFRRCPGSCDKQS